MTRAAVSKHEAFWLKVHASIISFSFSLFSYFEASVKQHCLRPLQKQTKAIAVDSTAITQKHTRAFQSYR